LPGRQTATNEDHSVHAEAVTEGVEAGVFRPVDPWVVATLLLADTRAVDLDRMGLNAVWCGRASRTVLTGPKFSVVSGGTVRV